MTAMVNGEDGDMSEQLALLEAVNMLPTLVIDEDGKGVLDLFDSDMEMVFDFEAMMADIQGEKVPFTYDKGVIEIGEGDQYMSSYTIPAGTYSGFDADAVTVTVKATLVCRADLPDDVAYVIVSTIYNNAEAITALHAKGAELSLSFATDGIAVPFAKGAAKFFAENGIDVATAD